MSQADKATVDYGFSPQFMDAIDQILALTFFFFFSGLPNLQQLSSL